MMITVTILDLNALLIETVLQLTERAGYVGELTQSVCDNNIMLLLKKKNVAIDIFDLMIGTCLHVLCFFSISFFSFVYECC